MTEAVEITLTPEAFRKHAEAIQTQVGKVIVGQEDLIHDLLVTLFAGGNALLEGVPGLGKTLLIQTLSRIIRCGFARIQFTPDLMPADILGTMILTEMDGRRGFRFEPGPIFANLILSDEVNRASPRTQSALLEAMQEHRVTVSGQTRPLPEPFFVLATQNPIEMEGTYPLPEAQLDRFFYKINIPYPDEAELVEIGRRTTGHPTAQPEAVVDGPTILAMQYLAREVLVADEVIRYGARLIEATHPDNAKAAEMVRRHVRVGSSPRGLQAIICAGKVEALLDGRKAVAIDDVKKAVFPALRHRLILKFEAQADGVMPDEILKELLNKVPVK